MKRRFRLVLVLCTIVLLPSFASATSVNNISTSTTQTATSDNQQTGFTLNSLEVGLNTRFIKIYPILTQSATDKGVNLENICQNFKFFKSLHTPAIHDIASEVDVAYGFKTAELEVGSVANNITCVFDFKTGINIDTNITTDPALVNGKRHTGVYIQPLLQGVYPNDFPLKTVSSEVTDQYINITYLRVRYQGTAEPILSVDSQISIDTGVTGSSTKAIMFKQCAVTDHNPGCRNNIKDYTGFEFKNLDGLENVLSLTVYPVITQRAVVGGVNAQNVCSTLRLVDSRYNPYYDIYHADRIVSTVTTNTDWSCRFDFENPKTFVQDNPYKRVYGIVINTNAFTDVLPSDIQLEVVSDATKKGDRYVYVDSHNNYLYQLPHDPIFYNDTDISELAQNSIKIDTVLRQPGLCTEGCLSQSVSVTDTPRLSVLSSAENCDASAISNSTCYREHLLDVKFATTTEVARIVLYPAVGSAWFDIGCSAQGYAVYAYNNTTFTPWIPTNEFPDKNGACVFDTNGAGNYTFGPDRDLKLHIRQDNLQGNGRYFGLKGTNNPRYSSGDIQSSYKVYTKYNSTDPGDSSVPSPDIQTLAFKLCSTIGCDTVLSSNSPQPCILKCNSNIVFIPGLMGSRLYERKLDTPLCIEEGSSGYCVDKKWLPYTDSDIRDLYLKGDGTSVNTNIVTKDVVDSALGAKPLYKSLVDDMASWQQTGLVQNATSTPYDWRLSIDDIVNKGTKVGDGYISFAQNAESGTTPYILDTILKSASSSRTGKVTLVAHSNGGLVAKAIMQKLRAMGREDIVDNLILIASPQIGTPDAGAILLHGSCIGGLDTNILNIRFGCIISDPAETRGIAKNMPAAYHLLPSNEFFNTQFASDISPLAFYGSANTASSIQYGAEVKDAIKYRQYLKGTDSRSEPVFSDVDSPAIANAYLLNQATITHDSLDAWRPASTTKVTEVSGFGVYTIAGLNYVSVRECDKNFAGSCVLKYVRSVNDQMTINGDETVVSPSAHYLSSKTSSADRWFVNLQGTQYTHKDILEVPELRSFIKNTITKATSTYSTLTNSQTPPVSNVEYYSVRVHSPLNIHLYDNLGNHTGLTASSTLETNIPGSQYFQNGTVKTIIAPKANLAKVTLDAYASGSFTVDQEIMVGDTILASSSIQAIPTATSTKVTISLNQTKIVESPIQVDLDGDNTTDISATPVSSQSITYALPVPVVSQTPVIQVSYGGSGGSLYSSPLALKTEAFPINMASTTKPILTQAINTKTKIIVKKIQKNLIKKPVPKKVIKKQKVKFVKKPIIKTKKKNI